MNDKTTEHDARLDALEAVRDALNKPSDADACPAFEDADAQRIGYLIQPHLEEIEACLATPNNAPHGLAEAAQEAKVLIGAKNDRLPIAVRESNINQAWHVLDRALAGQTPGAVREDVEDVFHRIDQWAKAYPLDVFPEPDLKEAAKLLKANGMTLDAISASNMRHVITKVVEILKPVRAALAAEAPRQWEPVTPDMQNEMTRFVGTRFNGVVWGRPHFWHWHIATGCFRSGGTMPLRWDMDNQPTHCIKIDLPPVSVPSTREEK